MFLRYLFILIVFLTAAFYLSGCDKYTRHEVLTFFFTGVPPVDGGGGEVFVKNKKRKAGQQIMVFIHGPKAAGECYHCHQKSTGPGYGRKGKRRQGVPTLNETMPGNVKGSISKLCIECHVTKTARSAVDNELWLHGPLAAGICNSCHHHHSSRYNYMLVSKSSRDLCSRCHAEGFLTQSDEHKGSDECISCHNPHLGKNRYLLKKDYVEVF